jgi:two-component system chemotaxis sensor kinase CheA
MNILTSGKFIEAVSPETSEGQIRYIIMNLVFIAGGLTLIIYGVYLYYAAAYVRAYGDLALGVVCFAGIILLRTKMTFFSVTIVPVSLYALLCVIFLQSGGARGFASVWVFILPVVAYLIMGLKTGTVLTSLLFIAICCFSFFPGLSSFDYSGAVSWRLISVYLLETALVFAFEFVRVVKEKYMKDLARSLKSEHDEITVMRDSLKSGLFMMNKDFIIQGQYSTILETILDDDKLEGKRFTDYLTLSLTSSQLSTLKDYFDIVFRRAYDADILEDINPIQELKYIVGEAKNEKTLRCHFLPIDRGSGETFIMGNIEDITAETELQEQLRIEEEKRQNETRSMFEILQINPDVFHDFIEDAEYEFDTMNEQLKNNRVSSVETLVEIYKSIHAIKANAIILGLSNYGDKIHAVEDNIKDLQQKAEITFDDMLHLTVLINDIMKDKDNFKDTIEKIKKFSVNAERKSNVDILIESLKRACDKTAVDLGKSVELDSQGIDPDALNLCPRRMVKEALFQLVRNAVYHGIESPKEREALNKDKAGKITISIKNDNEMIHIRLQDDGKGLEFEKIRERAVKMHLIKETDNVNNNRLLQAIFAPGFSTAGTTNLHAGRGIGLSLVRDSIKEQNGTITIQTELGKGTAFNIFLPVDQNVEAKIS